MKHLEAWIRLWMMRMLIGFVFLSLIFSLTLSEIILPLNPELADEIYNSVYGSVFSLFLGHPVHFDIPYQQPSSPRFIWLIAKFLIFCVVLQAVTIIIWDALFLIYKLINGNEVRWYRLLPHPRYGKEYEGGGDLFWILFDISSLFLIIFISIGVSILLVFPHAYSDEQFIRSLVESIYSENSSSFSSNAIIFFVIMFILSTTSVVTFVRFVLVVLPLFKSPPQNVFPYQNYFSELCDKLFDFVGKKIKARIGEHRFDVLMMVLFIIIVIYLISEFIFVLF